MCKQQFAYKTAKNMQKSKITQDMTNVYIKNQKEMIINEDYIDCFS